MDNIYRKKISQEVARGENKKDCIAYYDELKQETLLKEWKAKGKTDRDWTKLNVIVLNDVGKAVIMKNSDYKAMMLRNEKAAHEKCIADLNVPKNKMDASFAKI